MRIMKREKMRITLYVVVSFLGIACTHHSKNHGTEEYAGLQYVFDMVHNNPGESATISEYNNPDFVKSGGYNGMVVHWYINCAITYDNFEENIVQQGSEERKWIEKQAALVDD